MKKIFRPSTEKGLIIALTAGQNKSHTIHWGSRTKW